MTLLSSVESLLHRALVPRATELGVELARGSAAPPAGVDRLLSVAAESMEIGNGADQDPDRRAPAYLESRIELTPGPDAQWVELPAQADVPVEVEAPEGRLARPGDAWWQDGRRLNFYRAPEGPVRVRIRHAPAAGYRETLPGLVRLVLEAWATEPDEADAMLLPALGAALGALLDLDLIDLGRDESTGFELRLLRPRARPWALEHHLTEVGGRTLACSRARLTLAGELEITLALGEAPTAGTIEGIEYRYRGK